MKPPSNDDGKAPPSQADPDQATPPVRKLQRRRLLRYFGAAGGLGVAGVGSYGLYEAYVRGIWLRGGNGPARAIKDHRVEVPSTTPKLVIARGSSPTHNVTAALDRMGSMSRFVSRGDVVVLKPNVGFKRSPLHAATTNPELVAALVLACRDAGAGRVLVVDCPAHNAEAAFSQSGIRKAALEAGAEVVLPGDADYVNVELPSFGRWPLLAPFAQADKLINIPATKQHNLSRVTVGMKNWFGVLGGLRHKLHDRLDDAIVELSALMRPTLTVVDATRLLMRNGPQGGSLADVKDEGAIAVSLDPVAADSWGAGLLGAELSQVRYLRQGEARGLGSSDVASLSPVELQLG